MRNRQAIFNAIDRLYQQRVKRTCSPHQLALSQRWAIANGMDAESIFVDFQLTPEQERRIRKFERADRQLRRKLNRGRLAWGAK